MRDHRHFEKFDLTSSEHMADAAVTFDAMRATGDLAAARIPFLGNVWLATRHSAAVEVLKDTDRFTRQPENAGLRKKAHFMWWMPPSLSAFADNMLMFDGAEHKRLRGSVDQAFARRDILALTGDIETVARDLLAQCSAGAPVDILKLYSRELPMAVICELLGLQDSDRAKAKRWAEGITTATSAFSLVRAMPGISRLRRFLLGKIQSVRQHPEPGLLSLLANPEIGETALTDSELVSMAFVLFLAGHETTTHFINGTILSLLEHPEQKKRLLADWSLLPMALEEVLRHMAPVQMTKPRFVTRDMEFYGTRLRQGDKIIAHIGAANRDPLKYENTDVFDMTRKPNPHLSFSTGIHFCLGLQLARLEAQVAIRTLFEAYPNLRLAVPPDHLDWRERIGLRALNSFPLVLEK